MKEMLYEVRCLKSNEDIILALAGQLSHEPEKLIYHIFIRFQTPHFIQHFFQVKSCCLHTS